MIEAALGRLAAMKTDLLPPVFFERMLGAADEAQARRLLVGTVYEAGAARAGEGAAPAALERELWRDVFGAWCRLGRFLEGSPAELLLAFAGAFEVDNVRQTVRRVLAAPAGVAPLPLWDLGEVGRIDIDALARARTMLEIEDVMAHSPYARAFELAHHRIVAGDSLFSFEQTLEANYVGMLQAAAGRVRGSAGRSAREYLARRIQLTNARWALRLRFGRGLPREETMQYLAAPAGRAARADIEQIVSAGSLVEAAPVVQRLCALRNPPEPGMRECDRAFRAALGAWARTQLRRAFFQFASLFAFCDVRAQEVRDIAAVLAGKRQGRPGDAIRARLGLAA